MIRCLTCHLDTYSLSSHELVFLVTKLQLYQLPSPVMKLLFKDFRVLVVYCKSITTAFLHPINFHFSTIGTAGNQDKYLQMLLISASCSNSQDGWVKLTTQVRFKCSTKPREGFEDLQWCSGLVLLGHGIIFLLTHGRIK